jgi:hypothetical protein
MTSRSGDALSHVYFKCSRARLTEISASEFFAGGGASQLARPHLETVPVGFCMAAMRRHRGTIQAG